MDLLTPDRAGRDTCVTGRCFGRRRGSEGRIALAPFKPSLLQLGEPEEEPDHSKKSEFQQRRCHSRNPLHAAEFLR